MLRVPMMSKTMMINLEKENKESLLISSHSYKERLTAITSKFSVGHVVTFFTMTLGGLSLHLSSI